MPRETCPARLSPREAVRLIPDGATVLGSGFASMGIAHALHRGIVERFLETGSPRALTYVHAAGHTAGVGLDALVPHGIVRKIIGGHWGLTPAVREAIAAEAIEAHNWPQGVIVDAIRAAAAGHRHGHRSRIGLGTFIDPRHEGGCVNGLARSAGATIRLVDGEGGEQLLYAPLAADIALIRGWSADRLGNVSLGMEPLSLSAEVFAMAARAAGGRVLCQVRTIDDDVVYPAHRVAVPGFLVDALVVAENPRQEHRQCDSFETNDALVNETGGNPAGAIDIPGVAAGPRGWIGRRAALEIRHGDVFNLGIGIPGDTVGAALHEAGRLADTVPTIESGLFGGVALGGNDFGCALFPTARLDQAAMFDFYHGGGLDVSIMGAAEIDRQGNVNVSRFDGRAVGCGGFIDITQSTRRIVFCTTLTAGGLDVRLDDGRLAVVREGRHRKFVERVGQVTFDGQRAVRHGQDVLAVTERCVLRLGAEGWTIVEVACGVDPATDILPHIAFKVGVLPGCPRMPATCFR